MTRRRSIVIDGFQHTNPIPHACMVGNLLVSGGIPGFIPGTTRPAATLEEQCAHMFAHVRAILEKAGGTTQDIVKVTLWMNDPASKEAVNKEWLRMFPDEGSRPARHTQPSQLGGGMLIQCDFTAVLGDTGTDNDR